MSNDAKSDLSESGKVIPLFERHAATVARRKALWESETGEVALWRDLATRFYEAWAEQDWELMGRASDLFEVARDTHPDDHPCRDSEF